MVLLAPDLERYRRTRGLYVDFEELSGGEWASTWPEALAALDGLFRDPARHAAAGAHSRRLAARFHTFTDGRNAERVAQAAAGLVADRFGTRPEG